MTQYGACMLGGLVALATACADPDLVRVVESIDSWGNYALVDHELTTLTDLGTVDGTVAKLQCDATLDLLSATLGDTDFVEGGDTPAAQWVDQDGVAIALDFDSLALFSIYAHIESASLMFQQIGASNESTSKLTVQYRPKIDGGGIMMPGTDNAFYVSLNDQIFVLPNRYLDGIPLAMNVGVVTHEYAHRVFQHEVLTPSRVELLASAQGTINLLAALNEGLADYFGATNAADPRYLSPSFEEVPTMAHARDLSFARDLPEDWIDGLEPTDGYLYDPYAFGSVVASTLWRIAESVGRDAVSRALMRAERTLAAQLARTPTYDAGDFELLLLAELDATAKSAACTELAESYDVLWDRFAETCP